MSKILSEERLVHLLNETQIVPMNTVVNAMLQAVYDSHEELRKRLEEAEEIVEEVAKYDLDLCFYGNAIEYKEKYKEE